MAIWDERRYLIALRVMPALGHVRIARVIEAMGTARGAFTGWEQALGAVRGIGNRLAAAIVDRRNGMDVDDEIRRGTTAGAGS